MTDDPKEGKLFRPMVGLIAVVGSFAAFLGLFMIEIPQRNENALMFAMGIVFGWGSMVFASEYGSSNVGRKVAEAGIKNLARNNTAVPENAKQAAQETADSAQETADEIRGMTDADRS